MGINSLRCLEDLQVVVEGEEETGTNKIYPTSPEMAPEELEATLVLHEETMNEVAEVSVHYEEIGEGVVVGLLRSRYTGKYNVIVVVPR